MNLETWYESGYLGQPRSPQDLYFLPLEQLKHGGWSGILVDVDLSRPRAKPRAKKSSVTTGPRGSGAHWTVGWLEAREVPPRVVEAAAERRASGPRRDVSRDEGLGRAVPGNPRGLEVGDAVQLRFEPGTAGTIARFERNVYGEPQGYAWIDVHGGGKPRRVETHALRLRRSGSALRDPRGADRYEVEGQRYSSYADAQRRAWDVLHGGAGAIKRVVVRAKLDGRWQDREAWSLGEKGFKRASLVDESRSYRDAAKRSPAARRDPAGRSRPRSIAGGSRRADGRVGPTTRPPVGALVIPWNGSRNEIYRVDGYGRDDRVKLTSAQFPDVKHLALPGEEFEVMGVASPSHEAYEEGRTSRRDKLARRDPAWLRSARAASRQVWLDVSDASGDPTPVSLEQFERENPELDPADLREVRMLGIGEGFAISRGVRVRRVEAPPRPTPTRRGRGSTPSRRDPASRMLRDKPRGASPVARKPAKDTGTMTAGEVNRELEKLEKSYYLVVDELIKAGRGHETANDTWKLDDPLARRFKTISSRRGDLRNEIELRYGPRAPSRLPRGFGPRRDPASRGASPNRRRKR